MSIEITEELLSSVLEFISQNPRKAACNVPGNQEANLLAIRELRRRGLITGKFLNDPTRPRDHLGPFLADAAHLELD